ncbi:MAG: hypothetical protein IPO21_15005 [Bacteroidales bacterium]|nr:hypothetical protein [Bacteroidales bacterium]
MTICIKKYFLLLWALFAICSNTAATPYAFMSISTAEGLSHKTVNCVPQDRQGFIWIGTSDGLNRFDGYSFKKYFKNVQDSLSLKNNNVNAMTEDLAGNLWLCTGRGFCCYSPIYESFSKIHFKEGENNKLAEDICVDNSGRVWGVENSNTIINLNSEKNYLAKHIKLDSILGCKEPLFNKRITYADGFLWVFSSLGVIRFNPSNTTAVLIKAPIEFTSPRSIRKGNTGELFLVDWNQKIYTLNTKTLVIELFKAQEILKNSDPSVGNTDVLKDKDGALWILKFPGLNKISASGELEEFNITSGYDKDYDKLVLFNAMQDYDGNIWLGTQDEGVIVISKSNNIFKHISINTQGFKDLYASSFVVDDNEVLMCNNFGAFHKKSSEIASSTSFSRITSNVTSMLAQYKKNEYVVFEKTMFSYTTPKQTKNLAL